MDVATLVDRNPAIGAPHNPHPKKVLHFPGILHLQFPGQLGLHVHNISSILTGNEQIVDQIMM